MFGSEVFMGNLEVGYINSLLVYFLPELFLGVVIIILCFYYFYLRTRMSGA
jgi:hypothetical protein